MIYLSDIERFVKRFNYSSVVRTADTQSVHDPNKLIDLAAYRAKVRRQQLEQGYRNRRPQPPSAA